MARLLIGVKSCHRDRDRGDHQVIRETWGRNLPLSADLRFFVGGKQDFVLSDESAVDCEDDYDSLPYKTREICRWFLKTANEFVFLCDTDTFIIPNRLVSSGYVQYDYSGRFGTVHPIGTTFEYHDGRQLLTCHPWASGGIGYFLSRKAAQVVASSEPRHWAEDFCTGQLMGPLIQTGEIKAGDLFEFECNISWHWPRRRFQSGYDPKFGWMQQMQKDNGQ